MATGTPSELFFCELGGLYDAEHQFLEAMRPMAEAVCDEPLRAMIRMHIIQTEQQIRNLEQVFSLLGRAAERPSLEGPRALVADGERLGRLMVAEPSLFDGAVAASLARIEAHEVACYRGLLAKAARLDRSEVVGLLRANLDEEEQIVQLAVNYAATLAQRADPASLGGGCPTDGPGRAGGPGSSVERFPGTASATGEIG